MLAPPQARLKKSPGCSIATLARETGPFRVREVVTWLRNAEENVLSLYWLGNRPRR
jgi:hypothetical protein